MTKLSSFASNYQLGNRRRKAIQREEYLCRLCQVGERSENRRANALLDLAEEQDIDVDYGCRAGNCGACIA